MPKTAAPLDPDRFSQLLSIDRLLTGSAHSIVIDDPDRIAEGVGQFVEFIDGPMAGWRAGRTALAELVAAAEQPQQGSYGMGIDSRLVQSAAALCTLDGRDDLASDPMAWFLANYEFRNDRKREQAKAFDGALRDRFPGYDAARAQRFGQTRTQQSPRIPSADGSRSLGARSAEGVANL